MLNAHTGIIAKVYSIKMLQSTKGIHVTSNADEVDGLKRTLHWLILEKQPIASCALNENLQYYSRTRYIYFFRAVALNSLIAN